MRTVHKFSVHCIGTIFEIRTGETFKPLTIQNQNGKPQIWAEVNTAERQEWRHRLIAVGTGHLVPDGFNWIGTWQDGPYVWHLYGMFK